MPCPLYLSYPCLGLLPHGLCAFQEHRFKPSATTGRLAPWGGGEVKTQTLLSQGKALQRDTHHPSLPSTQTLLPHHHCVHTRAGFKAQPKWYLLMPSATLQPEWISPSTEHNYMSLAF